MSNSVTIILRYTTRRVVWYFLHNLGAPYNLDPVVKY